MFLTSQYSQVKATKSTRRSATQVQLGPQSLKVLQQLMRNLQYLLGVNQVHLDKYATTPEGQREMAKAVSWALAYAKALEPLTGNDLGHLSRNANTVLQVAHTVLSYLKPTYQRYLPAENHPQTLTAVEQLYTQLMNSISQAVNPTAKP
jgi:hypothetical protein